MHDILIQGGTVVDGTGAPARQADVAVNRAKRFRSGHEVYDPRNDTSAPHRMMLLGEMRRLARIKIWKHLEAPPTPGAFPYRLALRELTTERLMPTGEPLRAGREYQLVLFADSVPARIPPRYVYVFNIDRDGDSTLLVSIAGHGNVENLVPDLRDIRDRAGPPPTLVPLGHGFKVTPPYGRDTVVLITSASALPNPDILAFSAGRRAGLATPPSRDALSWFLFGLNTNTRASRPIPTAWSVQRLVIESTDR